MIRLLTLFLALALLGPGIASARAGAGATGFYAGTLGGTLAVTLSLRQDGSDLAGYYHYDKYNVDIRLAGQVEDDGALTLFEYGYFEITGIWRGHVADGRFSGRWESATSDRTMDFVLDAVARPGQAGEPTGAKVAFGAMEIDLPMETTRVPAGLAATLVKRLLEEGGLDAGNEYQREVVEVARTDPARLFSGELSDLDDDGTPELAVRIAEDGGACTAHNCPFWIFRRDGGAYAEILAGHMGYFGYAVLNQTTAGFRDIVLLQHSSAAETDYVVYRYDGGAYRQATCIAKIHRDEDHFSYKEPCE